MKTATYFELRPQRPTTNANPNLQSPNYNLQLQDPVTGRDNVCDNVCDNICDNICDKPGEAGLCTDAKPQKDTSPKSTLVPPKPEYFRRPQSEIATMRDEYTVFLETLYYHVRDHSYEEGYLWFDKLSYQEFEAFALQHSTGPPRRASNRYNLIRPRLNHGGRLQPREKSPHKVKT